MYKNSIEKKKNIPGFKYLSRADKTDSNMLSKSKKLPIHSEMIVSTCSGNSMSSIFPGMTWMMD